MKPTSISLAVFFTGALACVPARAQFSYAGCDNLVTADFQTTELFNKTGANTPLATNAGLAEPVQFDVQGVMNPAGDSVLYTNIYLVERKGKVKFYDGLAKRVDSIGYIPNWAGQSGASNTNDNGLMGIVLDPKFNTNKRIYFWYCPPLSTATSTASQNRRLRLSRITLNAQNKLDMSSEKILIDILGSKTDTYHSGGPMTFDRNGDLWVTVGNNSSDLSGSGNQYSTTDSTNSGEWGSSNTASLRGGVFRIHPDDNATAVFTNRSGTYGPGYTIPAGNFGEYWGDYFQSQGNATLAAQYRDTSKVRPEVYIKGTRSNYSIAVHPKKNWLAWGDVQYNSASDEYNLVDHPAFMGMPYFMGNNQATPAGSIVLPVGHSAATPINNSPLNSGVHNLPPATAPLIWYANATTINTMPNNVAIGGPIYAYDRNLKSDIKFPPHLDNSWILMTTYGTPSSGGLWITKLDSVNPVVTMAPQQQATTGTIRFSIRNPLQAKYGPDGALYTLFYGSTGAYASGNNPGVIRTSYVGSCKLAAVPVTPFSRSASDFKVSFRGDALRILEEGAHEVTLREVSGKKVFQRTGTSGAEYSFRNMRGQARAGVYVLEVKTGRGTFARNVSLL